MRIPAGPVRKETQMAMNLLAEEGGFLFWRCRVWPGGEDQRGDIHCIGKHSVRRINPVGKVFESLHSLGVPLTDALKGRACGKPMWTCFRRPAPRTGCVFGCIPEDFGGRCLKAAREVPGKHLLLGRLKGAQHCGGGQDIRNRSTRKAIAVTYGGAQSVGPGQRECLLEILAGTRPQVNDAIAGAPQGSIIMELPVITSKNGTQGGPRAQNFVR